MVEGVRRLEMLFSKAMYEVPYGQLALRFQKIHNYQDQEALCSGTKRMGNFRMSEGLAGGNSCGNIDHRSPRLRGLSTGSIG